MNKTEINEIKARGAREAIIDAIRDNLFKMKIATESAGNEGCRNIIIQIGVIQNRLANVIDLSKEL